MKRLIEGCITIERLFDWLDGRQASNYQRDYIQSFRYHHPDLDGDLNFCFEVLAGKYKLGYTLCTTDSADRKSEQYEDMTIIAFYTDVLQSFSNSDSDKLAAAYSIPLECNSFLAKLANRTYRLGFSNKNAMITKLSPMLAKKYPDDFEPDVCYYLQEKLDGNRCLAHYDAYNKCWKFNSRSGKLLNVDFDMSWAPLDFIFDGEIMTLNHAESRDFTKTSGVINSKYIDKSNLHYYIYDMINDDLKAMYKERYKALQDLDKQGTGNDCSILPVIDTVCLCKNSSYNWLLDDHLDRVIAKGGEGLILRLSTGLYEHKRSSNLLKYKRTQTMDLRIVGWNEGTGKYEGGIGSFICQTDDETIKVNVSGMSDDVRFSNPNEWLDKIVEVEYFDVSTSKMKDSKSLRFPRLKKVRDDKNETSKW